MRCPALLFLGLVISLGELAADPIRSGSLAKYVEQPDASYQWSVRSQGTLGGSQYAELILTSQTWRDIPWKHQLYLIKPASCAKDEQHALLFITGGAWRDELEQARADQRLPREAALLASVADHLQSPIAVLLQVPHQPILGGKFEDQIISHTFEKYLETGDPQWPLLLPMVKSAVRGMDATQEFARQRWSLQIEKFTLTGASKRGWTTWLTGAVDGRATALAPMVIDVLRMQQHMDHQQRVWGAFSEQINDYTRLNLHERLGTDRGKSLLKIVDPYSYRQYLNQPKLIILGTNDAYWPLDALNLYWDGLSGQKHILYVPNNGHGLKDMARVVGSLLALHHHAAHGAPLPSLSWEFRQQQSEPHVRLSLGSTQRPEAVRFWVSRSATRDFRQSRWTAQPSEPQRDGRYVYRLPIPTAGYAAVFGEAEYNGRAMPYFLSSNVRIVGGQ